MNQQVALISSFDNDTSRNTFSDSRKAIHNEIGDFVLDIINRTHGNGVSKFIANQYTRYRTNKALCKENVVDNVYLSLVHMHCNRLLMNRADESEAMFLLGYLLNKTKVFLDKKVLP